MSLCYCSAVDLLGRLHSGEVSSVELTSAFLDQIATHDATVHAFLRLDPRRGPGPRCRDRRAPANRSAAGTVGRPAGGRQGQSVYSRQADDVRVADAGAFRPALRCHRDRASGAGGRRPHRQDEHGRVRDGRHHGELALRPDAESLGPGARPGRLQRRLGGQSGGRHDAAVGRQRHRRLDPPAGFLLRRLRAEADLRPCQPLRSGRVCQQSGSDRSAGTLRRRRGAVAEGPGRP